MPPYPAYRPSGVEWLGDVPEHWGTVALRLCSVRYAGGTPDRNKDHFWDDGTIPWINSGAVNQKLITEPSALITNEGFAGSSAKWIPAGALVMALAGQGRTKGMVAQLAIQTTCNQSMAAIVPDERVSARYVFWLLDAQYEVIRNLAGGEQRDGLNLEILGDLPVLLPTLHEQFAIAAFLDRETERIDALVAKKRQLVERLQEYRTALITRTVTRGLPPEAARAAGLDPSPRLKPSGVEWLGEVPEHWEVGRLKWSSPKTVNGVWGEEPDGENDTVCVRVADFERRGFRVILDEPTERAITPAQRAGRELRKGDLLLEKSGGGEKQMVGCVVLYDHDETAVSSNFVARLSMARGQHPRFWTYVHAALYAGRLNYPAIKQTTGIQNLDSGAYFDIPVAFPPSTEQAAIAAYLDQETEAADALVSRVMIAIERLQEHRTALITAAVTGKVDVRDAANVAAGPHE